MGYTKKPIDPLEAVAVVASVRWEPKYTVSDETGCWLWKKPDKFGYGSIKMGRKDYKAHRVSWVAHHGIDVPEDLELDHLCRNRHCVNPLHLEAVPPLENQKRGKGIVSKHLSATHCPKGHEYIKDNLVRSEASKRHRSCKKCAKERTLILGRKVRYAAKLMDMTKRDYIAIFGGGEEIANNIIKEMEKYQNGL